MAHLAHQPVGGAVDAPPTVIPLASPTPVLAVDALCKRFGPDLEVLSAVTLSVSRGESVAVIGANGSGKSTLLRCCVRLIEPSAGRVRILDTDVTAARRRVLRRVRQRVGFVFQRHNLVPRLSVLSNVIHGAMGRTGALAWHQGAASPAMRGEAMHCLERVGLAELARRRADQLSGGQSQRVAIARALMQRPEVVLADEPVASLDPSAGAEVMDLFARLMRDEAVTVVFTTHNLEHARQHAGRVVALRGGRVSFDLETARVPFDALGDLYAR
ncbi:phosphonate ABC transporter ATP-binding protein [Rhodospira trueperi]|uniref:Phosphonate transport system ATP-binding protein n=1 Tax=Rhodospira trueperi TaxID=69960 RepID=A0A1G7FPG1_9PROT|nr:ATP-binding cassette domain-containing protein [Rhodospira trueperi]SDE77708.1 phosphonate transport system ATP-binding protein [Rhodospira trueperi]